ncbi:hypothetical protein BCR44DRAFT_1456347 [Catenaria anguillulae PL171]|uniref:Uncharacterized protein n=1 Tax=Catenaria anguillulae PL171 TaxID=765915 RepID=A0A1Y2GPJ1_9FUNG|nr:hypothetical protein BCR44DRAFT_1456347 [Catenaria anguillulae PL171]
MAPRSLRQTATPSATSNTAGLQNTPRHYRTVTPPATALLPILHPDPYTSTDPITLESANFDPDGKSTTKDPQEAMFRPIMPSNILFKFNTGPQKTLDDFKGLGMEAIGPTLGATTAAQSPATPPQPKWQVTPASLVNLDTFFALYKHSQKRFYFLWGEEPESHQSNHIKLTVDNLSALATANETILLVNFRFGFACLKVGVEGVVDHLSNGVLALDFGQDADHGIFMGLLEVITNRYTGCDVAVGVCALRLACAWNARDLNFLANGQYTAANQSAPDGAATN